MNNSKCESEEKVFVGWAFIRLPPQDEFYPKRYGAGISTSNRSIRYKIGLSMRGSDGQPEYEVPL